MDAESPKTSVLYALHKHIATTCKAQNRAFLACKEEHQDPSKCTDEGRGVITCVKDLCVPLLLWHCLATLQPGLGTAATAALLIAHIQHGITVGLLLCCIVEVPQVPQVLRAACAPTRLMDTTTLHVRLQPSPVQHGMQLGAFSSLWCCADSKRWRARQETR